MARNSIGALSPTVAFSGAGAANKQRGALGGWRAWHKRHGGSGRKRWQRSAKMAQQQRLAREHNRIAVSAKITPSAPCWQKNIQRL